MYEFLATISLLLKSQLKNDNIKPQNGHFFFIGFGAPAAAAPSAFGSTFGAAAKPSSFSFGAPTATAAPSAFGTTTGAFGATGKDFCKTFYFVSTLGILPLFL